MTSPALKEPTPSAQAEREGAVLWTIHQLNLLAIHAGQLALERGFSSLVRGYGHRLVLAHSRSDEQAMRLLRDSAMRLDEPAEVPELFLDAIREHKQALEPVRPLWGKAFDEAFTRYAAESHERSARELEYQRGALHGTPTARLIDALVSELREHARIAGELSG